MSQQDQHLTTEQLSAFFDKQLSPEEQAACSAHLVDCEQCQYALDNLQLTVNLLRSLPQLEVPRSFALSTDFKLASDANPYDDTNWIDYKAETQAHENEQAATSKKIPSRKLSTPFRRTLRTVSALAAVVGLFLVLSGFIATLSQLHMGGGMASSTGVMNAPAAAGTNNSTPPEVIGSQAKQSGPINRSGKVDSSNTANTSGSSTTTAHQPSSPGQSESQPAPSTTATNSTATWPTLPLIDFTQAGTRLSIGILLAILGWMGYRLFTRQQK